MPVREVSSLLMLQRQPLVSNNRYTHFSRQKESSLKHYHTIIIGGGPSGLVTSHFLNKKRISHCILERYDPGSSWRDLPDDFMLAMPVRDIDLPGLDFSCFKEDHHLSRDEMILLLEQYALRLPIQCNTIITSISQNLEKTIFYLSTSQGVYSANNVVICTGPRHEPSYPPYVTKINPELRMHSANYKNPNAFPDNLPILIIGSGLSALTIAYQIKKAGRHVMLACGYDDLQVKKNNKHLFHTSDGREKANNLPNIFLPSQLEEMGIINYGKLNNVTDDGCLQFYKDKTGTQFIPCSAFGKLIFATGYTQHFPFLKNLYDIRTKQVLHEEGVVSEIPGLYFVGIPANYMGNRHLETVIINQGSADARRIVEIIARDVSFQDFTSSPGKLQAKL